MKKETEEALMRVLGLTPDQVREEFLKMKPLDVGIFRKEAGNAGLQHGPRDDGA